MLVRLFPDLRGTLFKPDETLGVYAGVAAHLPQAGSIDEIGKRITSPPHTSLLFSAISHSREHASFCRAVVGPALTRSCREHS